MLLRKKINLITPLIKAKIYRRSLPFIVGWSLTRRCNYRCKYCDEWQKPCPELNRKQVFFIIDQMADLGTKIIAFDGGEPLLREDLGYIIDYAKKKDFLVTLNSNGALVPQKISEIKYADFISISLDGPEEVHDFIRGENSYSEVMNAVEVVKINNIPLKFNCTLSKHNLDCIDFILRKCEEFKVKVRFEPVCFAHSRDEENLLQTMYPSIKDYKKAIEKIINFKKSNKYIYNSTVGLKYIQNWPFDKKIPCFASRFICRLEPNGDLYPCTMMRGKVRPRNCIEMGFKKAFYALPTVSCDTCWCTGTQELNYLLSFNVKAMWNIGSGLI